MRKPVQRVVAWGALVAGLATIVVAGCGISCKAIDGWLAYEQIGWSMRKAAEAPPARLEVHGRVPVVHVYGTPREMGAQYGTLLRRPLRALRRCLRAFVSENARAYFLAYAEAHEPHLPGEIREELRAVAEASGLPYMELVAMNVVPKLACSALAVWDPQDANDPGLIMGRNAEYFSLGFKDRGMLVVVYHAREGVAVVSVNFLGMIGSFTGINARGVAFGNMLVFNAAGPQKHKAGLPIQIALRLAAQRSHTAEQMADLLRGNKHVIPMNVMVADRTQALVLELGVGRTEVRRGDRGVLAATNYFLKPLLRDSAVRCGRRQSLLAAARRCRGRMNAEEMTAALHDARIDKLNLQAVVFEPGAMRMHVSINRIPASAGPYVTFDLRELFKPAEPTPPAAKDPAE